MSTTPPNLATSAQERAEQAIAEAFPDARDYVLEPLHGGLSGSPVYKLIVDGRPYALRVMQRQSQLYDPQRQLDCIRSASERGITPPLRYASSELAVSISAYISSQPPVQHILGSDQLLAQAGELLRTLHTGPAFSTTIDAFQMLEGTLAQLAAAGEALPASTQQALAAYEMVKRTLQPHLGSAPCHNDINPGNMLFDGQRLWLIDWEASTMADPLFDLAGFIHWFLLDQRREDLLLEAYYQRRPTERELAKLALIKQITWWVYALIFFQLSFFGAPSEADMGAAITSFPAAMAAVGRGELQINAAATQRLMSSVIAQQALDAQRRPEFQAALDLLG